jgi:hypothetical protein
MTELTIRRIVIACDAACDIRVAVEGAAVLAARYKAALHGVFLEDENLYRLAGLPFGRQVTLSSAVFESFSAAEMDALSSTLGAAMRRSLAHAAAQHGLQWSFGVIRDLPRGGALAGVEGDILVVQSASRPFSGSWRPRSAWDSLPETCERTVLIRRDSRAGTGTVLILPGEGGDHDRILASGLAVAGPEDEVEVILCDGSPSDTDTTKRAGRSVGPAQRRKLRREPMPESLPALLRLIERVDPALVVIGGAAAAVRDLLARTRCDVLLVR